MKNKLIFKKVIRIIVSEVFFGKKNGFIVVKKKDYVVSRKECWSNIFSFMFQIVLILAGYILFLKFIFWKKN